MTRPRRRSLLARPMLALPLVPLLVSGCIAVPLSSLSSLTSLGSSSVSVGRDTYSWGALHSAELADFFAAQDASDMAARDLGLHRTQSAVISNCGTQIDLAYADDKGGAISVRIERRTAKLLLLREDVGWFASLFGAETTDRLFLLHLRQHLPPETAAEKRPVATQPAATRPLGPAPIVPAVSP